MIEWFSFIDRVVDSKWQHPSDSEKKKQQKVKYLIIFEQDYVPVLVIIFLTTGHNYFYGNPTMDVNIFYNSPPRTPLKHTQESWLESLKTWLGKSKEREK